MGKLKGYLYILDSSSFTLELIQVGYDFISNIQTHVDLGFVNKIIDENISLWHKRLGHPSDVILNHLSFCKNKRKETIVCDTCHLAKQARFPFFSSNTTSLDIFELIHVDIWGP